MGKRKSSRKPGAGKVKAKPLDKTFKCLFCQHIGTVLCKMDRTNRIGRLDCKDCLQSFQAAITPLDEPIDLYSQWIDACEEVNTPSATSSRPAAVAAAVANRPSADNNSDEDDDEDLPDLPGKGTQKNGRSPAEDEEEEEEDDAEEADDNEDEDDGKEAPPADMGYQRKQDPKMSALLEQRRSKAVVEDDEDDD